jgi:hypothetical protein
MGMYPEVRVYADPLEDRERRWAEISERPSDGEDGDVIDVYGAEAGPEAGYGFADFGRTIRVAAVVFAWAVFHSSRAQAELLELRPV